MSLNSEESKGAGPGAHAPRLQQGGVGYAAWKPHMDVYLQRSGADGIHRKAITQEKWLAMSKQAEDWTDEELAAAMQLVEAGASATVPSAASATSADASASAADVKAAADIKAARRLIAATVERSRRVHGILYSALPDELRPQVEALPSGWAYGLWHWLETKYQSTEQDAVGDLLAQWIALRQDDGESYDAYRARVNQRSCAAAAAAAV